jgi:hypothetical protein
MFRGAVLTVMSISTSRTQHPTSHKHSLYLREFHVLCQYELMKFVHAPFNNNGHKVSVVCPLLVREILRKPHPWMSVTQK